jgi:acyl-CoA synthetase (NDP forming)
MDYREIVEKWRPTSTRVLNHSQSKRLLNECGIGQPRTKQEPASGVELRIAIEQDPGFGHVLVFSYGKMAMDIWEDVSYRILPLSPKDARIIITEPKASLLLEGYSLFQAPNRNLIEKMLLNISDLIVQVPEIEKMDLDPVFAYKQEIVIIGASIEFNDLIAEAVF